MRIVPELDQPAHVGNGWNVPGWENYTSCVNQERWYDLCVQPPCGQLNPNVDEVCMNVALTGILFNKTCFRFMMFWRRYTWSCIIRSNSQSSTWERMRYEQKK